MKHVRFKTWIQLLALYYLPVCLAQPAAFERSATELQDRCKALEGRLHSFLLGLSVLENTEHGLRDLPAQLQGLQGELDSARRELEGLHSIVQRKKETLRTDQDLTDSMRSQLADALTRQRQQLEEIDVRMRRNADYLAGIGTRAPQWREIYVNVKDIMGEPKAKERLNEAILEAIRALDGSGKPKSLADLPMPAHTQLPLQTQATAGSDGSPVRAGTSPIAFRLLLLIAGVALAITIWIIVSSLRQGAGQRSPAVRSKPHRTEASRLLAATIPPAVSTSVGTNRLLVAELRESKSQASFRERKTATSPLEPSTPMETSRLLAAELNSPTPLALFEEFKVSAGPSCKFTNALGMTFVHVPSTDLDFCIWKTRVQDYAQFATLTGRPVSTPQFPQAPDHPVVCVTWKDACDFCVWLTKRELEIGRLQGGWLYRLPTDAEWSTAVGLKQEPPGSPRQKCGQVKQHYPWGSAWPPSAEAGCFGLQPASSAAQLSSKPAHRRGTAAVEDYVPNGFGLYELGSNAREWCDDWADAGAEKKVARGGSWAWESCGPKQLLSSWRRFHPIGYSAWDLGFRCVLARGTLQLGSLATP